MPRERAPLDGDHVETMYLSGKPLQQIAGELGVTPPTLRVILAKRGVPLRDKRRPRLDLDVAALVEEYEAGGSLKQLAARHGAERTTIQQRLLGAGVTLRSAGDQQRLMLAARTPEERRRNALAANAAARGRKRPIAEGVARALTMQEKGWMGSFVGQDEIDLAALLMVRSVAAASQTACGPYNIDLTIGNSVAVEVHGGGWHARETRAHLERKRVSHLLDAGWSLLIVRTQHSPICGATADYVVAFAEEVGSLPAGRREHRMIRGDGQLVPVGESKDD